MSKGPSEEERYTKLLLIICGAALVAYVVAEALGLGGLHL